MDAAHPGELHINEKFISKFCQTLNLTLPQTIIVAFGLVQHSDDAIQQECINFLLSKIPEFASGGAGTLPDDVLHSLLYMMHSDRRFSVSQKIMDNALSVLLQSHPNARRIPALQPMVGVLPLPATGAENLYLSNTHSNNSHADAEGDEIAHSTSLAEAVQELGPSIFASKDILIKVIKSYLVSIKTDKIRAMDVAQLLGLLVRGPDGFAERSADDSYLVSSFLRTGLSKGEERIIGDLTSHGSDHNVKVFIAAMGELAAGAFAWTEVVRGLDHPQFSCPNSDGLLLLLTVYEACAREPFPYDMLLKPWKNTAGQLSLLIAAINATFDKTGKAAFAAINLGPRGKVFSGLTLNLNAIQEQWTRVKFLETLFRLAECENYSLVRKLFEMPLKECPDILVLSMAESSDAFPLLRHEILSVLLPYYMYQPPAACNHRILKFIWVINKPILIGAAIRLYHIDNKLIFHIHQMGTSPEGMECLPGWITELLSAKSFLFVIHLAVVQCMKINEPHRLEEWLNSMVKKYSAEFVMNFLQFLNLKIVIPSVRDTADKAEMAPIFTPQICATFMKCLEGLLEVQQLKPLVNEIKVLTDTLLRVRPDLFHNEDREIENRCNASFQALYSRQVSVDVFIDFLKRMKDSKEILETKLYDRCIQSLLDEYKFFPNYPDNELSITAAVIGNLVVQRLISGITLAAILNCVLESLKAKPEGGADLSKQPVGSPERMYFFGAMTISFFLPRLNEWPNICQKYLAIPHFRSLNGDLASAVERIAKESTVTAASAPSVDEVPIAKGPVSNATSSRIVNPTPAPPGSGGEPSSSVLAAVSAMASGATPPLNSDAPPSKKNTSRPHEDSLDATEAPAELPPIEIQDAILVKLNNLTEKTVESVSEGLGKVLTPPHYPWLSSYLVEKRICTQPNYHDVYLRMLEAFGDKQLDKQIMKGSVMGARRLLKDKRKIVKEASERTALKNLGLWIGKFTLARNKPILHRDLDIKELLLQSYENGSMIAVVPFISNILKGCQKSLIFAPPNPWTMGMLGLFSELYSLQVDGHGIKINILFEIEILVKSLNLVVKEIEASNYFRFRAKPDLRDTSDFAVTGGTKDAPATAASTSTAKVEEKSSEKRVDVDEAAAAAAPNFSRYVRINSNCILFQKHPDLLREAVILAIDRSIREIIAPVVTRSVGVSLITTKEIIIKDFVMEPDENKVRAAAHLMVSNLAGNLAHATSKEPLRLAVSQKITEILASKGITDSASISEAAELQANENLDFGLSLMEKAATEKAMKDIDVELKSHYLARVNARNAGKVFMDVDSINANRFLHKLPDFLRPQAESQLASQNSLYQAYLKVPRETKIDDALLAQGAFERIQNILGRLAAAISAMYPHIGLEAKKDYFKELAALPADNEIKALIGEIRPVILKIASNEDKEAVCSKCANQIFKYLFENSSDGVRLPIYSSALQQFQVGYTNLPTLMTYWIVAEPDKRKLNFPVIVSLIRVKLIVVAEFDKHLAQVAMATGASDEGVIDFTYKLIRQVLLVEQLEPWTVFNQTFTAILNTSNKSGNVYKAFSQMYGAIQQAQQQQSTAARAATTAAAPGATAPGVPEREPKEPLNTRVIAIKLKSDPELVKRITYLLDTWISLEMASTNSTTDKNSVYLNLLQQQGVLKGDENIEQFFKVMTEIAVQRALSSVSANPSDTVGTMDYTAIDAYSQLVVLLMKYADSVNPAARINLFNKVLTIIFRTVLDDHDSKVLANVAWDQRPHFRLFLDLMHELLPADSYDSPTGGQILQGFVDALSSLSPLRAPGFAFSWLELISHRSFMPKLLLIKVPTKQAGWSLLQRLLVLLLKFMEPFLRKAALSKPCKLLYEGTLRVFLVLFHDFPEFLSDYHFSFCNHIPNSCVQLRNLILSALPRTVAQPDPYLNLRFKDIPECMQPPRVATNVAEALIARGGTFKTDLDSFLASRNPSGFLAQVHEYTLLVSAQDVAFTGSRYNTVFLNALVLYSGQQAFSITDPAGSSLFLNACVTIYQQLLIDMDNEGRYLLLNAIANQLRYPSSHTAGFSNIMLTLFADTADVNIRELITRVLFERLVVYRPHPWGLLITFIQLIKSDRYQFWNHKFTKCAPEIEKLFESVAQSIIMVTPL